MDWNRLIALATDEIETTLAEFPNPLAERARQLPVTFESVPNSELQIDGIKADTLGIFSGAELAEEGQMIMPSQIILFLENIWNESASNESVFRDEVRVTFLHELGHYLGLTEDDLIQRGLE